MLYCMCRFQWERDSAGSTRLHACEHPCDAPVKVCKSDQESVLLALKART